MRPVAALVFATIGATVLWHRGTHQNVVPRAQSTFEALATTPTPASLARIQPVVFPETTPVRYEYGDPLFLQRPAPRGPVLTADIQSTVSAQPEDHRLITAESSPFDTRTIHASALQPLVHLREAHAARQEPRHIRVERRPGQRARRPQHKDIQVPQIGRFIEGQTVRTLFIPLVNEPRYFTVVLQRAAGGPALGRIARITVIVDSPPSPSPLEIRQARAGDRTRAGDDRALRSGPAAGQMEAVVGADSGAQRYLSASAAASSARPVPAAARGRGQLPPHVVGAAFQHHVLERIAPARRMRTSRRATATAA